MGHLGRKKKKKHEWLSAFMKELREMLRHVHKVGTAATNQALIKYNHAHVSILDFSDPINVSNKFLLFISQAVRSTVQCLVISCSVVSNSLRSHGL